MGHCRKGTRTGGTGRGQNAVHLFLNALLFARKGHAYITVRVRTCCELRVSHLLDSAAIRAHGLLEELALILTRVDALESLHEILEAMETSVLNNEGRWTS